MLYTEQIIAGNAVEVKLTQLIYYSFAASTVIPVFITPN